MNTLLFEYNGNQYVYNYYEDDSSEKACIDELVTNNEYVLHNFMNNVDKHFVDIGANTGVATIVLAKQNPLSTVYAFEPDRRVFEVLKANIASNNISNAKAFNMAVTKEGISTIKLYLHPRYSGGNTTYSNEQLSKQYFSTDLISYDVECISLNKFINDNNINDIELLKIDCEGAEYDILYNSPHLKQKIIKNLVGEFHNLKYNDTANDYASLITYCKPYVDGIFKVTTLDI